MFSGRDMLSAPPPPRQPPHPPTQTQTHTPHTHLSSGGFRVPGGVGAPPHTKLDPLELLS